MRLSHGRKGNAKGQRPLPLEVPQGADRFEEFLRDVLEGFRRFSLLLCCLKLALFQRLKEERSLKDLQGELGAQAPLLFLVLENMVAFGLLEKTPYGYKLSSWAKPFLDTDSPFCQLRRLGHEVRRSLRWLELERLLKGEPVTLERDGFFAEAIHALAEERLLGDVGELLDVLTGLEDFERVKKALDLGGGHGLFSIALTQAKDDLEAWVFDLPRVLEETRKYVELYGAERVHFHPGDFFHEELPSGFDLVLSAYNPAGKRAEIVPKLWRALKTGGLYVNIQFFSQPEDYNTEDLDWNLWDFGMPKGLKAYTFKGDLGLEAYVKLLEATGFRVERVLDAKRGSKILIAKKVLGAEFEQNPGPLAA